jgi:hypothetical protein
MDLEIEELRRELSQWRESHTSHKRIPEGIWSRAAAAAQKFGVTPTSKALKLDYSALKRRMQSAAGSGTGTKAQFIELFQPAPTAQALIECVVEIQSSRGARLSVKVKNLPVSELAALARTFAD